MNNRVWLRLAFILALAVLAIYVNLDLMEQSFVHPIALVKRLTWQGEEAQRSLRLRRGLDLQGGLQVLLEVDREPGQGVNATDLDTAANTIKNRVDTLGVTEPLVQTQGSDKIVVELPGIQDPALAVRTVQQTALLEFIYAAKQNLVEGTEVDTTLPALYDELPDDKKSPFLGDPADPLGSATGATAAVSGTVTAEAAAGTSAPAMVAATTAVTDTAAVTGTVGAAEAVTGTATVTGTVGATPAPRDTSALRTIYPTVVTGASLAAASVGLGPLGEIAVNFELDADGARRMGRFTRDHVEEVMAIALDKQVISAPVLRDQIQGSGQITGQFTQADATALVAQLRSGALPFKLNVVGQTRIGPTLGTGTIHSAVIGGLVGLIVVMVFMLLYYRLPGLLADLALILYALFTLTLFRLIPVTLTLAGIAGFALSIGMAVDANILIFERMKEELRGGERIGKAMTVGFARAWPSIRDSNLSTLITCAILFWFGNQFGASIVKGFAVTLSIGVLVSMFTAIFVTRTFLQVANMTVLKDTVGVRTLESPRLRRLFGF
jgi:preprotein translocase subunit SecD